MLLLCRLGFGAGVPEFATRDEGGVQGTTGARVADNVADHAAKLHPSLMDATPV
jgi:hypothetical protein